MKILVLDDDHTRLKKFKQALIGNKVICVKTADECINTLITGGPFEYCFLDHDLGGKVHQKSGKGTGYEVAEFISQSNLFKPKHIIIHSINGPGARLMESVLRESGHESIQYIPFAWLKIESLN